MNDAVWLILLLVFESLGLISILVILNTLVPAPIERARTALETRLGRSLLLGLVNFLFAALLGGLLTLPARMGGIVAGISIFFIGLVALAVLTFIFVGLAGAVSLLGSRIAEAKSPVTANLRGGAMLVLACLTPYVGWLVFTPLVLLASLGASIQTIFSKRQNTTEAN